VAEIVIDRIEDDWRFTSWSDGNEQWMWAGPGSSLLGFCYTLERVVRDKSRRTRWTIVDRSNDVGLYPPRLIQGSFADADSGRAALRVLIESRR
jgi:hypothetical protein